MRHESKLWDKLAGEYGKKVEEKSSQGFLIRNLALNPYLFREIGNTKGKTILDYGCGDGWLSRKLADKARVFACDISEEFIKLARQKGGKAEYLLIKENKKLPYRDESFDIAISNIVLHITKKYKDVIDESYRVLKKNGKGIFTIMHPLYYKVENVDTKNLREESFEIEVEGIRGIKYYRRFPQTYLTEFKKAGFRNIKMIECFAGKKAAKKHDLAKYATKPYFLLFTMKK